MGRMPRRHNINEGERLPERFTRVEDQPRYWDTIETVLNNEKDPEFQRMKREVEERQKKMEDELKATVQVGDRVLLFWNGMQVIRVEKVFETGVQIGSHRYGWACIRKPSEAFEQAIDAEVLRLGMVG